MSILEIVSKIYDRNPVSYRLLRNLKEKPGMMNFLKNVIILPMIPIWNLLAQKEVKSIRKKGSVYSIRNGGTRFYLPQLDLGKGEFVQNRIFLERDYFEIRRLEQVGSYVNRGGCVLDIGANIGNHSLYFAKECHVEKIYAFEPVKSTFEILKRNIALNGLEDTVTAYQFALGDHRSKAKIIYHDGDAGGNRVEEDLTGNTSIEALDDIKFSEHIDFVKIDVEGYESKVLAGAVETLRINRPVIMIEIFDENYRHVDSLLKSLNYECKLKIENDYVYSCDC